jgi:uncharacterized protein
MKRIALIALVIALAAPAIARADDASKHAKIEELFTVMHIDQTQKQITEIALNQVKDASRQQLRGAAAPTPEQQKKLDDFQQKATNIVNGQIAWSKIEPEFVKLYNDAYTEPELDGILAFYKSPAGQAMLTKMPQLTAKSIELSRTRLVQIEPQLRQLLQDLAKDVNTPAPATAPTAPKGM